MTCINNGKPAPKGSDFPRRNISITPQEELYDSNRILGGPKLKVRRQSTGETIVGRPRVESERIIQTEQELNRGPWVPSFAQKEAQEMLSTAGRISLPTAPVHSTLLSLVQSLKGSASSEDEVVESAMQLVNSGRVVLTGNFKGCRLEH